ncbi:MAG: glycoside hydrolase family 88 protein [Cyclobacteriaceae bacterium]
MLEAAKSLALRFNPNSGVIRSWDFGTEKGVVPTIIDNMMNLELLLWAFRESSDSSFYQISISHADITLKNHFREDFSTYHVLDYDSLTGEVLSKRTHQGYSDSSTWARGQAWGIYGYTMMYRETGLERYLDRARKATDLFISRLPVDVIPFWDFDAPDIPNAPKDASAAAILSSAMLELATYEEQPKSSKY